MGNVLHCHWAVTLSRSCPTIETIQDLKRFDLLARSSTAQCPSERRQDQTVSGVF